MPLKEHLRAVAADSHRVRKVNVLKRHGFTIIANHSTSTPVSPKNDVCAAKRYPAHFTTTLVYMRHCVARNLAGSSDMPVGQVDPLPRGLS